MAIVREKLDHVLSTSVRRLFFSADEGSPWLLPIPNAERRHRLNFGCPLMRRARKKNPDGGRGAQISPWNARRRAAASAAAAAASAAQVADGGRTKPQAAASPAQQTLPQRRRVRTGGREERERMERTCQRSRERGKRTNGAPVRNQRETPQAEILPVWRTSDGQIWTLQTNVCIFWGEVYDLSESKQPGCVKA